MFGYVRVFAPGLRVSEYEAYKSAYCGFCKRLGKDYGQLWRLTLSYDFAFVKLLSEAMREDKLTACRERCIIHPLRKRYCMRCPDKDKLLSAAAVLLVYAKIEDNLADSNWIAKGFWRLLRAAAGRTAAKAAKDFPALGRQVKTFIASQQAAESDPQVTRDRAADPTGTFMAELFASLSQDERQKRVLLEFGYQMGRYVYFIDALDDMKKDAAAGTFNPFLLETEDSGQKQDETFWDCKRERAEQTINRCIGGAIDAYQLLQIHHMKPILDNVLYFGLQNTVKTVNGRKKRKPEQEMEIY